jgi:hypothetical protein
MLQGPNRLLKSSILPGPSEGASDFTWRRGLPRLRRRGKPS